MPSPICGHGRRAKHGSHGRCAENCQGTIHASLTCWLNFYATVLTVCIICLTANSWTLFTVTDSFQLVTRSAIDDQEVTDAVGTTLTQSQVVLAGTALISVAFQTNTTVGVGCQVAGVNDQRFTILRLELCHVEVEIKHRGVQGSLITTLLLLTLTLQTLLLHTGSTGCIRLTCLLCNRRCRIFRVAGRATGCQTDQGQSQSSSFEEFIHLRTHC